MHEPSILPQPAFARDWHPGPLGGTLHAIFLHWTAGDYATLFPAYHLCLSGATEIRVHETHDVRANMRDVRTTAGPYAAHTLGRNSFAAGIAICGMRAATPSDFGPCPLTAAQIEALCTVTARVVRAYGIAVSSVRTHAEAALDDGYFGAGGADERWDIARLTPAPHPLEPAEAIAVGEHLRTRIAALCR